MIPYDYYITPEEFAQAAENGISEVTFYNRIRQLGWSKEKAMTTPPRKRTFHNSKWVKIAEKNGICISTYKYRINQLGWEPERAATQPLQDRIAQAHYAHECGRKYPAEIVARARENGICYDTFRHRVSDYGWDMEKAATVPPMDPADAARLSHVNHLWKRSWRGVWR
ncbi:hypothetical protein [Paenibacillus alkalitolerans]|uniref:hypothetical protein n=1 Tax=Paenibacillus alkalitolerans TaxID=2799335 RepID=UPI0018F5C041|nr:hypothetical protein [Paenibacillus alkalitolerans]